jgi:predicted NAD/FAD-binding protein
MQFFKNHGLLSINDRPQWRTVVGGSCEYVRKMQNEWNQVDSRTGQSIIGISRHPDHATVHFSSGVEETFDHIIIATHADHALKLLSDPSPEEQAALGCWKYTASRTILHTDESVMPPMKKVWSSWNFQRIKHEKTCLTYHMNRLQGLNTQKQYFVSLNLPTEPDGIIAEFNYTHPMYTQQALRSREDPASLNGSNRTWFAGSYFGNGFHEDAVRSAVDVARGLGEEL